MTKIKENRRKVSLWFSISHIPNCPPDARRQVYFYFRGQWQTYQYVHWAPAVVLTMGMEMRKMKTFLRRYNRTLRHNIRIQIIDLRGIYGRENVLLEHDKNQQEIIIIFSAPILQGSIPLLCGQDNRVKPESQEKILLPLLTDQSGRFFDVRKCNVVVPLCNTNR